MEIKVNLNTFHLFAKLITSNDSHLFPKRQRFVYHLGAVCLACTPSCTVIYLITCFLLVFSCDKIYITYIFIMLF